MPSDNSPLRVLYRGQQKKLMILNILFFLFLLFCYIYIGYLLYHFFIYRPFDIYINLIRFIIGIIFLGLLIKFLFLLEKQCITDDPPDNNVSPKNNGYNKEQKIDNVKAISFKDESIEKKFNNFVETIKPYSTNSDVLELTSAMFYLSKKVKFTDEEFINNIKRIKPNFKEEQYQEALQLYITIDKLEKLN